MNRLRMQGARHLANWPPALLFLILSACTSSPDIPAGQNIEETPGTSLTSSAESPAAPAALPASRLASHIFMPVGSNLDLSPYGQFLELIDFSQPPAFSIQESTLLVNTGGQACLRFRYRQPGDFNSIQTLCVLAFDEVGSCEGLEPLSLDLNRFLAISSPLAGNANLLEAGEMQFYSACLSPEGAYRLQQPKQPLPPLYFVIVDALGDDHPYALGREEFDYQRNGVVVTYSAEEIQPPWIIPVSRELEYMHITQDRDVGIAINRED